MKTIAALAIGTIVLSSILPVVFADKAKSRLLSLSSLTVDRESRVVLSLGMIVSDILFTIFWFQVISRLQLSPPVYVIILTSAIAFFVVAVLLFMQYLKPHYFWVRVYMGSSYLIQLVVAWQFLERSYAPIVLVISNAVITTALYTAFTRKDRFYFEWTYVGLTCVFVWLTAYVYLV